MLQARISRLLVALVATAALTSPALAVDEVFVTADGAIRGYDAVAYHTRAKPVRGNPGITHSWNGATWRFASIANRELFAKDPERYAPRYGGYCAYGTANGYKVSTQPDAFAIVEGRLYLNNTRSVQLIWNRDRPGHIAKADHNWKALESTAYLADE